jgi:hypothetical protein
VYYLEALRSFFHLVLMIDSDCASGGFGYIYSVVLGTRTDDYFT